jgi:transposase
MLAETQDDQKIIKRVAALDIGRAELVCCVRVPDEDRPGRRLQEVETYATMTRPLLGLADRLRCLGVTRVVMEATSDYWKPVFYLLEAHGFQTWLVNARDVRHLPGRPKTDKLDAVWLAKVAERQMIRPSFVPPPEIRRLRDVTRYRADLVAARTAEKQRAEKMLEDAQIKLSAVVSDIFGVSGRQMLAALIAGQRDPRALAQLARGVMRRKITTLQEAFTGYSTGHHAFLLAKMLARVDAIDADLAALDATIEQLAAPFTAAVRRLAEIPGINIIAACAILAESGSPGALPHRGPLRTVHAPHRRTRLKQAPGTLRAGVLASCVCGPEARGGRRRVSSGFGCHPVGRARPGGRGARRRSPCGPRSATTVPTPLGTGAGQW